MKLVYKETGIEVKEGDIVLKRSGNWVVESFRPPHKPDSEGKVAVRFHTGNAQEYYVSVIGAEWIEREDRVEPGIQFRMPDAVIWTVISNLPNGDWVCRESTLGVTCNFPASIIAQRLVNETKQK